MVAERNSSAPGNLDADAAGSYGPEWRWGAPVGMATPCDLQFPLSSKEGPADD